MDILGMLLTAVGIIMPVVGGVWLIVLAFKKSLVWGLLCLFVSPVALVFAVQNWAAAKRPFLIEMAGVVVLIVGIAMASSAMMSGMEASALFTGS